MKLSTKWLILYSGVGLYTMILGGIFYCNQFRWTFDEKLKQQAIDLVRLNASPLIKGLAARQSAITLDEYDVIANALAKDERVSSLVYLNRYGEVRWHKDTNLIGSSFDGLQASVPLPTDAVASAHDSRKPQVREVAGQPFYEVAIPLAVRGDVVGIVDMLVSREAADRVIARAMGRFILGATGVLLLLGLPLTYFLRRCLLAPLEGLCDAVDAVSLKSLELKFDGRKDEVGRVAAALSGLLKKVKAQKADAAALERRRAASEQSWWQSVLTLLVSKGHRAVVVDEDNSVLYTNFPAAGRPSEGSRLHLLDLVDGSQQHVLRLVSAALQRPNQALETDALVGDEPCRVRALHIDETGEFGRTLVIFEPKRTAVVGAPSLDMATWLLQ